MLRDNIYTNTIYTECININALEEGVVKHSVSKYISEKLTLPGMPNVIEAVLSGVVKEGLDERRSISSE